KAFYRELLGRCRSEEFRWQLRAASRMTYRSQVGVLGNSLEAHRSVITAIACFTTGPTRWEDAVGKAIGLGNDTDTLAAMAAALSGAKLGIAAVPPALIERLEDGRKGRRYVEKLAGQLYERYEEMRTPRGEEE